MEPLVERERGKERGIGREREGKREGLVERGSGKEGVGFGSTREGEVRIEEELCIRLSCID